MNRFTMNIPKNYALAAGVIIIAIIGLFLLALRPVNADDATPVVFEIQRGESFHDIVHGLAAAYLIRSTLAFEMLSLADGGAFHLKPGLYQLNSSMSSSAILGELTSEGGDAITVTIPEGENIYEIDAALANALVIHPGELIRYNATSDMRQGTGTISHVAVTMSLEGRLFPDTYQFARGSDVRDVVQKFLDDFRAKAEPVLGDNTSTAQKTLIIASILEKEVPDPNDQKIVAGILQKRLQAGMPLGIDATVCYAALVNGQGSIDKGSEEPLPPSSYPSSCRVLNFKLDSPYNTYLYKGLPPTPIGNPGLQAINAALHPQSSPYWYYLSDPKTKKTIYAATLAEQSVNRAKYLEL
jgi:UPF0755 protein